MGNNKSRSDNGDMKSSGRTNNDNENAYKQETQVKNRHKHNDNDKTSQIQPAYEGKGKATSAKSAGYVGAWKLLGEDWVAVKEEVTIIPNHIMYHVSILWYFELRSLTETHQKALKGGHLWGHVGSGSHLGRKPRRADRVEGQLSVRAQKSS